MESVKRTAEASVARFVGSIVVCARYPALKRWAIFDRRLKRTKTPYVTVGLLLRILRLLQQCLQISLPNCGNCMRAVTASLIADRDHHKPPALDAFDFLFDHSQLRRIDEVVR